MNSESQRIKSNLTTIVLSGGAQGVAHLVSAACAIVSVPLIIKQFGSESYGLWTNLGAWIAILQFLDCGIPNAMVTPIASALGANDAARAREIGATAILISSAIALTLALVALGIAPFFDVQGLLHLRQLEEVLMVSSLVAALLVMLPCNAALRYLVAKRQNHRAQLWSAASNIVSLLVIGCGVKLNAGFVITMSVATAARTLVMAIVAVKIIGRESLQIPEAFQIVRGRTRELLASGLRQTMANLGFLVHSNAIIWVAPHAIGLGPTGEFAAIFRLYTTGTTFISMFITAAWPVYSFSLAQGDHRWIKTSLRWTIGLGVLVNIAACAGIYWSFAPIEQFLFGRTSLAKGELAIALCLLGVSQVWQQAFGTLLQGIGQIKYAAIYWLVAGAASAFGAYQLGKVGGAEKLVWGWLLGFWLTAGLLLPLDTMRQLRRIGGHLSER